MARYLIFLCLIFSRLMLGSAQDSLVVKELVSVYDGDTFKINLNCDYPIFCQHIGVRVLGVDAPEMKGKCIKEKQLAVQSKKFVDSFLSQGPIVLKNIQRDKYFRILAEVYVRQLSLAEQLILRGLAVAYDGETKEQDWCRSVH